MYMPAEQMLIKTGCRPDGT